MVTFFNLLFCVFLVFSCLITEHGVDGLHDVPHFLLVDDPGVVQVVHLERPHQLVLGGPGGHQVHR